MNILTVEELIEVLEEAKKYLRANPGDHYVVVTLGSSTEDRAASEEHRSVQVERIRTMVDDCLDKVSQKSEPDADKNSTYAKPAFLRPSDYPVSRHGPH